MEGLAKSMSKNPKDLEPFVKMYLSMIDYLFDIDWKIIGLLLYRN